MGLFNSKNAQSIPTKTQIAEAIDGYGKENKINYICPICRCRKWDVAGVLSHDLQREPDWPETSRTYVPTALLICANCSYCAQFSLVALGLLK